MSLYPCNLATCLTFNKPDESSLYVVLFDFPSLEDTVSGSNLRAGHLMLTDFRQSVTKPRSKTFSFCPALLPNLPHLL